MSKKNHREGGKFGGTHTTLIPAAVVVADIAAKQSEVTKIVLGFIKAGLSPVGGHKRVKITDSQAGVTLSVRDVASHQELLVFTNDRQATKLAIARGARDNDLHLSFGKEK
jgi:hypothetical protein